MAELNLKQIIDRLNAEFAGEIRKLVFWYDDKAEFAENMEIVELQNAKILIRDMMITVKNIFIAAVLLSLFVSFPSLAADLHNIPNTKLEGVNFIEEPFPYGFFDLYEKHFLNVPDYVLEYYGKCGGTFTFTTRDIDGDPNENILGYYYEDTNNIEVKLDMALIVMQDSKFYSTPAHELGHFIQTRTGSYWTDEMRDALQKEFLKRSKTSSVVINQKEAFAYAYADYVIMPWKVNPEMRETIKTCLDVIKQLNGGGVDTWVDIYPDPSTLTAPGTVVYL